MPRAVAALLALGLVSGSSGCGSLASKPAGYEARPGAYDRLENVLPEEVAEVQRLRAEGALDTARAFVGRLAAREPRNLPLGGLRQDVELEAGGAPAAARLRSDAVARLEATPDDLVALLLAGRLEEDARVAGPLLERALELAPDSAWSHYALAHLEAREGRWGDAAERLERALLVDPGHLWARRLQTQLLARGGPWDEAAAELRRWLDVAARSPFFQRRDLDAARLDLAQVLLLEGRPRDAAAALDELDQPTLAGARAQQLWAAIHQAEKEPDLARAAARRAAEADPADPLALVQLALLEEDWLGDPAAARRHWGAVLEATSARNDLGALLLALRARAALERLERTPDPVEAGPLP